MLLTKEQKAALVGKRVELHPATDRWMMGDRYGEIVGTGYKLVHVKLDKSGQTVHFAHENVRLI